jgi:hypothetical protein
MWDWNKPQWPASRSAASSARATLAVAAWMLLAGCAHADARIPRDEAEGVEACFAEVRALHREADRRTRLISFLRVPRDLWRVLPSEEDCSEEDRIVRIKIDWVKNCLKNIRYYAKGGKLAIEGGGGPGPCWRDKKYFCAVDPQSYGCLRDQ